MYLKRPTFPACLLAGNLEAGNLLGPHPGPHPSY